MTRDAAGNVYAYDAENHQKSYTPVNPQLPSATYFYDGDGKRVKKISQTESTIFVYDGAGKLIAEYSINGTLPSNPQTSYVVTDTLQSVRAISNQNGEVTSRRDFLPFGEELYAGTPNRTEGLKYSSIGSDNLRKRFTGYEKDTETGLDFAEARYYNNQHGRFTAVDPLLASGKSANPQTFNRYIYVMNSPLRFTDPSGMQAGNYAGTIYRNANGVISTIGGRGFNVYDGPEYTQAMTDGYTYRITNKGYTQLGLTSVLNYQNGAYPGYPKLAGLRGTSEIPERTINNIGRGIFNLAINTAVNLPSNLFSGPASDAFGSITGKSISERLQVVEPYRAETWQDSIEMNGTELGLGISIEKFSFSRANAATGVESNLLRITSKYGIGDCVPCASEVTSYIKSVGGSGVKLEMQATAPMYRFVRGETPPNGSIANTRPISFHVGVEYNGRVYDNFGRHSSVTNWQNSYWYRDSRFVNVNLPIVRRTPF